MELKKVTATKASEICADIDIGDEAKALLSADISPGEYLQKLLDEELNQDAARFLARALPKREATWWACVCARNAMDEESSPELVKALEVAEQWVYKPTDENRYASYEAVENLDNDSPSYWAGMAAFWSGGSMSPPDTPVNPPADNVCSMAVAGAVMLSTLVDDPKKMKSRYALSFKQGIAVANGANAKEIRK